MKLKRVGECARCGMCCMFYPLSGYMMEDEFLRHKDYMLCFGPIVIRKVESDPTVVESDQKEINYVHFIKKTCKNLRMMPDGTFFCIKHEDAPELCKEYPRGRNYFYTWLESKGARCGFRFVEDEDDEM